MPNGRGGLNLRYTPDLYRTQEKFWISIAMLAHLELMDFSGDLYPPRPAGTPPKRGFNWGNPNKIALFAAERGFSGQINQTSIDNLATTINTS